MKLTESDLRELLKNIIFVAELHPEHKMPTLLTGAIMVAKMKLDGEPKQPLLDGDLATQRAIHEATK